MESQKGRDTTLNEKICAAIAEFERHTGVTVDGVTVGPRRNRRGGRRVDIEFVPAPTDRSRDFGKKPQVPEGRAS